MISLENARRALKFGRSFCLKIKNCTDEVGMDNKDVRVSLDQIDQLLEVDLLLLKHGGGRHDEI